jgi:hypothetical protein
MRSKEKEIGDMRIIKVNYGKENLGQRSTFDI